MEADKEVAPPFRVSPDETGQQMETEEPFETVKEEEEEGEEGEENEATGGQPKVSVQPGSSAAFKRISRAREVLTSDDERRQYDLSQKGSSEDTKWAASLIEEARDELAKHQNQQQAAAQKTVNNLPAAVLQLVLHLKDPRLAVRKKALSDLGSMEAEDILEHLARVRELALKDDSPAVRTAAVKTLLKLSFCKDPAEFEEQALPAILAKLEDQSPGVRKAVVDGAAGIKAVLATHMPAIVAMLKDPKYDVRQAVVETLGKLEPAVLATHAPAIVARLKDSESGVRRAAVETLSKLEPAVQQSIVQQFESAVQEFESAARKRKRVADEGSSPG
jgi:HEAT repeat protein